MERALTLVQLNDSHGYVELHRELFWIAGTIGLMIARSLGVIVGILTAVILLIADRATPRPVEPSDRRRHRTIARSDE